MNETIFTLCLIGCGVLVFALTIWIALSHYRRFANDELAIIFNKFDKTQLTDEDGKVKTKIVPSKIMQGGGSFVWPIIQDYKKMSMTPIQIKETFDGIDSQAIQLHLSVVLTTAISQDKEIQQNAVTHFLNATPQEIQAQISKILIGESRDVMTTMLLDEISANQNKFLAKVRTKLEKELTKIGYDVININILEITDNANYIKTFLTKVSTNLSGME